MARDSVVTCTCISSEPHNDNIRDILTHYLGCIEIGERATFFNFDQPHWAVELDRLVDREIRRQPWESQVSLSPRSARLGRYDPSARREVELITRNALHRRISEMERHCADELLRIRARRATLARDVNEQHLISNLHQSRFAWQSSETFEKGIRLVQDWRRSLGLRTSPVMNNPGTSLESEELEESLSELAYDPNVSEARVMQFDGFGRPSKAVNEFQGLFPHQTITLRDLFSTNHLRRMSGSDMIKYFHFPANNMDWIEEAMAGYFGELRPDFDAAERENSEEVMKSSFNILHPQFWRGRQAARDDAPAHHRQMLPLCTTLVSEHQGTGASHLVVFMPYLHWDSDRNQSAVSRLIDTESDRHKRLREEKSRNAKKERQERRMAIRGHSRLPKALVPAVYEMEPPQCGVGSQESDRPRVRTGSLLGRYLLDAARLFEAISIYEDKALLRKTLFQRPPLHPRRTLDQVHDRGSQSWTGKDRQQVLFRATAFPAWQDSAQNLRKEAKLLMVDQLWLWILDGSTLITAFPTQYGFRKNQPSDVHKSIRGRVAKYGGIESVYELGLIVIDECANRVFDRAVAIGSQTDQQPILEVFTEAIAEVRHKQTMALQHIFLWSQEAKRMFITQGKQDILKLKITPLDITAETVLQMETNDIIDELETMIGIVKTHVQTLESFLAIAEEQAPQAAQGRFKHLAHEMRLKFKDRYDSLAGLKATAQSVALGMKDILALKEQQDNLFQAWRAQVESVETVTQGRAIVVFTIVTAIFLPLSFMSSVFGMNAAEFSSENSLSLVDQFKYMLPISAGISFFSIIFAFSRTARSILRHAWLGFKKLLVNVTIYTGLRWLWSRLLCRVGPDRTPGLDRKTLPHMRGDYRREQAERKHAKGLKYRRPSVSDVERRHEPGSHGGPIEMEPVHRARWRVQPRYTSSLETAEPTTGGRRQ